MYANQNSLFNPMQKFEVVQVSGENGARAFQMPPNSSVLLLDNTAPLIWFVQTDGAGYKTLNPYSITPYVPEPPIDIKSLEQRLAKLEEVFNHAESNNTTDDKTESDSWKPTESKGNNGYY